jgi:hypothetical protein
MAKGRSRGKGRLPAAPRGKPVPRPKRVGRGPGDATGGKGGSRGKGKIPKPGSGK